MIPTHQNKHTLMALGYGALLLAWLSTENTSMWLVSLLGAGVSGVGVGLGVLRYWGGRRVGLAFWVLCGGVVGFGAIWSTVGLMIFKNGWHAHAAPDFAALLVVGMARRLIPWTLAGALFGAAWGLLRTSS